MSDQNNRDEKPYEVGFGKPPKGTQFKPGQSGNPNGRPRKQRPTTVNAMIGAVLHEPMTLADGRKKTFFELIIMRMLKDVAEGKVKQWIPVLSFLERFDPKVEFTPSADDTENFAELLTRLKAGGSEEVP